MPDRRGSEGETHPAVTQRHGKGHGLRTATAFLRNFFAHVPGEGEAFVTENGKTGRIGRSLMCGSCPEGMVRCYRIQWSEEYKD